MAKSYLVVKMSYGDFDIAVNTPIAVSTNKSVADQKCSDLNSTLSAKDIQGEVSYSVYTVKNLDKE